MFTYKTITSSIKGAFPQDFDKAMGKFNEAMDKVGDAVDTVGDAVGDAFKDTDLNTHEMSTDDVRITLKDGEIKIFGEYKSLKVNGKIVEL